ncbi:MAG TPA: DUF1653 domain-containing protein [Alphaproteobacteria bacterium]|nr:DUF1653 domain-containing protein [Alphaproteobacteria bacterium]HNS44032.1 DUF1653 domain-containing protein [Alphaproteobacteria bacterium]
MQPFETYRHYKGGLYIKLCEGLHTETDEELVVYACAVRGEVFCRPKDQFYADINENCYSGPRFTLIPRGLGKEEAREFLKNKV